MSKSLEEILGYSGAIVGLVAGAIHSAATSDAEGMIYLQDIFTESGRSVLYYSGFGFCVGGLATYVYGAIDYLKHS